MNTSFMGSGVGLSSPFSPQIAHLQILTNPPALTYHDTTTEVDTRSHPFSCNSVSLSEEGAIFRLPRTWAVMMPVIG